MSDKCFDCEHMGQDRLCQTHGIFDPFKLAASFFQNVMQVEDGSGGAHWSFACVDDRAHDHPEQAWELVLAMLPLLETAENTAHFAAGPLETLIAQNGDLVIERIEAEAVKSPRFRYMLSGVWSQGKSETETWKRVEKARADGPSIDDGDPIPPK